MADITDESLEAAFAGVFDTPDPNAQGELEGADETSDDEAADGDTDTGDDAASGADDDGGAVEEPADGEEGQSPEHEPADEPTNIRIGDVELSLEDAQSLVQLQQLLSTDPAFAQHLVGYFQGPQSVLPEQQQRQEPITPQPADDPQPPFSLPADYLENEVVKALYDINVQQWKQIQQLQESFQVVNNDVAERRRQELVGLADTVAEQFQSAHNLSAEEMTTLRQRAGQLGIVTNLVNQGRPVTEAFQQALEITYWSTPEYRTRDLSTNMEANNQARKRKAKAASISGSAGSAPRTVPKPKTEQEKREAMVAEIADKWQG